MLSPCDNTEFDDTIQKYHTQYGLPNDWRLIKAQLFQESRLECDAASPVGAVGLAQFMPDTWTEYVGKCSLPHGTKRTDATASIKCCCAYMSDLLRQWKAPRSDEDRYNLALASYNAGLGNILKAQKMAKNSPDYDKIISHLIFVTGQENAKQTRDYITKIRLYHQQLLGK